MELLNWAREESAWILEDDFDGEFRYSGRPLGALRNMDGSDCVVYSNTFPRHPIGPAAEIRRSGRTQSH